MLRIFLLVSVSSTTQGLKCFSHWNGSIPIEKNCVPQHERCFTRINATGELQSRGCAPIGRCRTCTEGQFCGTQVNSSGHTFKGCLRMEQCKKPIDIRTYKPATNGSSKWSVVITACCDTDLCNAPLGYKRILLVVSLFSTATSLRCVKHWNGTGPIEVWIRDTVPEIHNRWRFGNTNKLKITNYRILVHSHMTDVSQRQMQQPERYPQDVCQAISVIVQTGLIIRAVTPICVITLPLLSHPPPLPPLLQPLLPVPHCQLLQRPEQCALIHSSISVMLKFLLLLASIIATACGLRCHHHTHPMMTVGQNAVETTCHRSTDRCTSHPSSAFRDCVQKESCVECGGFYQCCDSDLRNKPAVITWQAPVVHSVSYSYCGCLPYCVCSSSHLVGLGSLLIVLLKVVEPCQACVRKVFNTGEIERSCFSTNICLRPQRLRLNHSPCQVESF
ncbi:hypothetical protein PRIPAC_89495 [Pristionchus pacificus]|uniref:Uncharacterized protein n=1 Tax=Pristionchus pacificus TaxID=54126 RepID=A0A2A6B6M7_PRIPA|nr:hypothetical protein PRIPAC_89495 [Pristionchus pacificus]|eukprot:PDM61503.1 hypothetical protein PRIPAC_50945 [Pristionchus pacificus]